MVRGKSVFGKVNNLIFRVIFVRLRGMIYFAVKLHEKLIKKRYFFINFVVGKFLTFYL